MSPCQEIHYRCALSFFDIITDIVIRFALATPVLISYALASSTLIATSDIGYALGVCALIAAEFIIIGLILSAILAFKIIGCVLVIINYALEKACTFVWGDYVPTKNNRCKKKKGNRGLGEGSLDKYSSNSLFDKLLYVYGIEIVTNPFCDQTTSDEKPKDKKTQPKPKEEKAEHKPSDGTLDKWLATGAHQAQLLQRKQQSGTLDQWLGLAPKPPAGLLARLQAFLRRVDMFTAWVFGFLEIEKK
jgi:hypothetical protein